jgi:hypothetical protein
MLLRQRIAEQQQPRLIISTYPLYAVLLETLSHTQDVPPLATDHHRFHQCEPHLGHVRQ